ncbi:MAG: cob(I)yrinic acid a,c-diamide adenosyltransferase [Clostridia bacterium]|nr:cob(I)yrinic acid a,c-diamide adenosyltransferase [Clostridia bacterium]
MIHKLHIYTGNGKGKTTAGMGMALRFLGHDRTVLVAQFLKKGNSGELTALGRFPGATMMSAPPLSGFTFRMTDEERRQAALDQTAFAGEIRDRIELVQPDMILLDELNNAVALGMVPEDLALRLIDTALRFGETVSTGRSAPESFLARADYITRMEAVRHPYLTEQLRAREGVEW